MPSFILLLLSHFHVLILSLSPVCLRYCWYIAFPFQSFSFSSLSCFSNSFGCFLIGTLLLILAVSRLNAIFHIPSKTVFLGFHPHLASYQSSSSLHLRYIKPVNMDFRVQFFIHCYDFPSLFVYLIKFVFVLLTIPSPYVIKEIDHVFMVIILLLSLSVLFMISFVFLRYSVWNLSFILFSLILLSSRILRYLYINFPLLSWSSHHQAYLLHQMTLQHLLLKARTAHTFNANSISISLLIICSVETSLSTSRSLFAKVFRSSLKQILVKLFSIFQVVSWFYFS